MTLVRVRPAVVGPLSRLHAYCCGCYSGCYGSYSGAALDVATTVAARQLCGDVRRNCFAWTRQKEVVVDDYAIGLKREPLKALPELDSNFEESEILYGLEKSKLKTTRSTKIWRTTKSN